MRHEQIQKKFHDHFAMDLKDRGLMLRLTQYSYTPILFLTGTPNTPWTQEQIDIFRMRFDRALDILTAEAAESGRRLEFHTQMYKVTMAKEFFLVKDAWHKEIMRAFGYRSISDFHAQMFLNKRRLDMPVFFVNNNFTNPQFAVVADRMTPVNDEFSVVRFNSEPKTIVHELLHQFGAADLYAPYEIRALTDKYLPNSIMYEGTEIDPLTRYLIGWTDELPRDAVKFLKETARFSDQVRAPKLARRNNMPTDAVDPDTVAFKTTLERVL